MLHSKSTYFYRWSSRYISIAPIACALTLLVGVSLLLNPTTKAQQAHAAGESGPATTGSSISFSFNNNTQPNTSTTVEPGYVSYIPNVFAVNTTNIYKYDMYITAAEGRTQELVGTTYHGIINGVGDNIAPDDFGENTWGYAFSTDTTVENSNMTYSTLPAHGTKVNPQYSTDYNLNDTESREFKIVFAARIMGDTRPADHYYSQALISVVAESKEIVEGFGGVQTMQEFTPEICKHKVSAGTTGRLEDIRKNADGSTRVYWVAKLADGNCWMTQNLDLDLVAGKPLTPDDSDVTENWDPGTNTLQLNETAAWGDNVNVVGSYDPGMLIYANAKSGFSACNYITNANCSIWKRINTRDWTPLPYENNDITNTTNDDDYTYDAHYLIGNYYSFAASTAGTLKNSVETGGGSICAKDWRLPSKEEYESLLASNGISNNSAGSNRLRQPPLYYTPTGGFNDSWNSFSNGLSYAGATGNYRTTTPEGSTSYPYTLYFTSSQVYLGGGYGSNRAQGNNISFYAPAGYPVRCLVPGN